MSLLSYQQSSGINDIDVAAADAGAQGQDNGHLDALIDQQHARDFFSEPGAISTHHPGTGSHMSNGLPQKPTLLPDQVSAADDPHIHPHNLPDMSAFSPSTLAHPASLQRSKLVEAAAAAAATGPSTLDNVSSVVSGTEPQHQEVPESRANEPPQLQQPSPFRKKLDGLVRLQSRLMGTRLKVHDVRAGLRQEREALSDLDARFISSLRLIFANNPPEELSALLLQYENLQKARDELQPKEYDYNFLEDQLIQEEYAVREAENQILPQIQSARTSFFGEDIMSYQEGAGDGDESTTSTPPETYSPTTMRYYEFLGEEESVRERLAELQSERARLIEFERSRARVGIALGKDEESFLADFDRHQDELQQELASVLESIRTHLAAGNSDSPKTTPRLPEKDVENWMAKKDAQGDAALYSSGQFDEVPDLSMSNIDLEDANESGALVLPDHQNQHDPLLLDENDRSSIFSLFPPSAEVPDVQTLSLVVQPAISTLSFINQWLLDSLRRSDWEVRRFKLAPALQVLTVTAPRMKDLVLEWWPKDKWASDFPWGNALEDQSWSLLSKDGEEKLSKRSCQSGPALPTLDRTAEGLPRTGSKLRIQDHVQVHTSTRAKAKSV